MSTRTKVTSVRSPARDVRSEPCRRADPRVIRRGGRSKSGRVRGRTMGALAPCPFTEILRTDAMAPEQGSPSISMLLDVEFDHDEFDEFALGQARSMARAICHEEDEAYWA